MPTVIHTARFVRASSYLFNGAADSAVANIGIDFDQEVAANDGGLQLLVPLVCWDDSSPSSNL